MGFSSHALDRMKRRKIPVDLVRIALEDPDEVVEGEKGRKVYQKLIDRKLLRVVVEEDVVVTVYMTSKVSKYYHGGGER